MTFYWQEAAAVAVWVALVFVGFWVISRFSKQSACPAPAIDAVELLSLKLAALHDLEYEEFRSRFVREPDRVWLDRWRADGLVKLQDRLAEVLTVPERASIICDIREARSQFAEDRERRGLA